MKISVIIPMYNSSKFIENTLDSIFNQTFTDFEILLMNDGSTDNTSDIIKQICAMRKNVFLHESDNRGLCYQRNKGLSFSTGEYVFFMDHDDLLKNNCFEECVKILDNQKIDLVKFGYEEVRKERIYTHKCCDKSLVIESSKLYDITKVYANNPIFDLIWNGMYRREVLIGNKLLFDETFKVGFEDLYYNLDLFSYNLDVYLSPLVLYEHIIYGNNLSFKYNDKKFESIYKCYLKLISFIKKKNRNNVSIQYLKLIIRLTSLKDYNLGFTYFKTQVSLYLLSFPFLSFSVKDTIIYILCYFKMYRLIYKIVCKKR